MFSNSWAHWEVVAFTVWGRWACDTTTKSTVTISFDIPVDETVVTSAIKSFFVVLWAFGWVADALEFWAIAPSIFTVDIKSSNFNWSKHHFGVIAAWLLEGRADSSASIFDTLVVQATFVTAVSDEKFTAETTWAWLAESGSVVAAD